MIERDTPPLTIPCSTKSPRRHAPKTARLFVNVSCSISARKLCQCGYGTLHLTPSFAQRWSCQNVCSPQDYSWSNRWREIVLQPFCRGWKHDNGPAYPGRGRDFAISRRLRSVLAVDYTATYCRQPQEGPEGKGKWRETHFSGRNEQAEQSFSS